MTLMLVRGGNDSKVISSIKSLEFQTRLFLISKPIIIDSAFADSIVEEILGSKVKRKSKVAVAFYVKDSAVVCISKIKKIHLKAHVIVVNNEYDGFSKLEEVIKNGEVFEQYDSFKFVSNGMIDYSIDKDKRQLIKNEKLNSYMK